MIDEQLFRWVVMANNDIRMLFAIALKRKREDENEVTELALLLVAKFGKLVGTTATRDFTCQRILYRVRVHGSDSSSTKVVEIDLAAYRCAMTAGKAEAE